MVIGLQIEKLHMGEEGGGEFQTPNNFACSKYGYQHIHNISTNSYCNYHSSLENALVLCCIITVAVV